MYAKNLYIALYDEQTDRISYPYYVDEQDQGPVGDFAPGKGRTEYVLRHGQAALITPQEAARLSANGEVELVGSECVDWLGAPLKSGTQNFGVIAVQSYSESIRYSDRDREVLNFVSQHLANAILRKRNEEALRDSEQRYRSLVQSAVYGIYRSGTEDRFLEVNPALVKMLGYDDAKEVLDLSLQHHVYLDADERAILVDKYSKGGIKTRWQLRQL
jgi:PAS domain-containing protein